MFISRLDDLVGMPDCVSDARDRLAVVSLTLDSAAYYELYERPWLSH
jgi:hypothetical protein